MRMQDDKKGFQDAVRKGMQDHSPIQQRAALRGRYEEAAGNCSGLQQGEALCISEIQRHRRTGYTVQNEMTES